MSNRVKAALILLVCFIGLMVVLCSQVYKVEQRLSNASISFDPRAGMAQYAESFSNTWINSKYYVTTPIEYENIIIDFSVPLLSQQYSDGEWLFTFTEILDNGAYVIVCNSERCFPEFFVETITGFNGLSFDGVELKE